MPDAPVRTRFAPSPTGRLHLGNLRIAVFNALFARRHGGRFVLRIEDTDEARNLEGAVEGILEDLSWAGLAPDEGPGIGGDHGPYVQSLRSPAHVAAASQLLETGAAYRCFCTPEELEAARARQRTEAAEGRLGCPGGCRELDEGDSRARARRGEPHTVRFRTPDAHIRVEDAIRGGVRFQGRDVGDFVLLRADGRATYNLAVVVDDADMAISHVIRGDGHLSNTPKHLLLFRALDRPVPVFAHLPVVLSPDGGKLSKRSGSPGVDALRREGHLPHAVVNYLSLLGGGAADDREVLDPDELLEAVDLSRAGANRAAWDPVKLRWMTTRHLRQLPLETLAREVAPFLAREDVHVPGDRMEPSLRLVLPRLEVLADAPEQLAHLWPSAARLQEGREALVGEEPGGLDVLARVRPALDGFEPWRSEALGREVRRVGAEAGVRGKALFHPLRLAISGVRSGPDLGDVLEGMGRREALHRLDAALASAGLDDGDGPV